MERESRESWASFLLPTALIIGLVALLNLGNDVVNEATHTDNPLEPWLKLIVGYLAIGAEIAAALGDWLGRDPRHFHLPAASADPRQPQQYRVGAVAAGSCPHVGLGVYVGQQYSSHGGCPNAPRYSHARIHHLVANAAELLFGARNSPSRSQRCRQTRTHRGANLTLGTIVAAGSLLYVINAKYHITQGVSLCSHEKQSSSRCSLCC